jgi:hypothetical protein
MSHIYALSSHYTGLIIDHFACGVCRVTDLNDETWNDECRISVFSASRVEYPFLKHHLFGNWWVCDWKEIKPPKDWPEVWCQIVQGTKHEEKIIDGKQIESLRFQTIRWCIVWRFADMERIIEKYWHPRAAWPQGDAIEMNLATGEMRTIKLKK